MKGRLGIEEKHRTIYIALEGKLLLDCRVHLWLWACVCYGTLVDQHTTSWNWFLPKHMGPRDQRRVSLSAEPSHQSKHLIFKSSSEPQFNSLENVDDGALKSQCVGWRLGFLHTHEDLNLDPQCREDTSWSCWGGNPAELSSCRFTERPCFKKQGEEQLRRTPRVGLWLLTRRCTCTWTHMYMCTHENKMNWRSSKNMCVKKLKYFKHYKN